MAGSAGKSPLAGKTAKLKQDQNDRKLKHKGMGRVGASLRQKVVSIQEKDEEIV